MAKTLDLVLPVEWPFPPLVDIPLEDRPRVAMHIAHAFRAEARRWEEQAFRLAADLETPPHLVGLARPSITKGDQRQGSPAHGLKR
jgi:hypothetical protein